MLAGQSAATGGSSLQRAQRAAAASRVVRALSSPRDPPPRSAGCAVSVPCAVCRGVQALADCNTCIACGADRAGVQSLTAPGCCAAGGPADCVAKQTLGAHSNGKVWPPPPAPCCAPLPGHVGRAGCAGSAASGAPVLICGAGSGSRCRVSGQGSRVSSNHCRYSRPIRPQRSLPPCCCARHRIRHPCMPSLG